LDDALGSLLSALVGITLGSQEARCAWEEEPGEHRWILTPAGDRLRVRILAFEDVYDTSPDERGRVLFDEESEGRPGSAQGVWRGSVSRSSARQAGVRCG
jgi:hypothetical protein